MTIAFLGDSITFGANSGDDEIEIIGRNFAQIKELLNGEE